MAELICRPALESDLPGISALQQKLYSIEDAVPLEKLREWFRANPNGFFIFENSKQEPLGQVTFLPLQPGCLGRYRMEGEEGIIEKEISGEDLYGVEEIESISDLYLESLILPVENRALARQVLAEAMPKMISAIRKKKEKGSLFALAATPAGEKWLTKMGFRKISRAEGRKDRHDLYQVALNEFLKRTSRLQ